MSNYTKKAVTAAGIVFVMNIVASVFSYLLRLLLARNLSVAEYGLVYAIFSLFGLVSIFKRIGLNSAMTKFIAEYKINNDYKGIKSSIIASTIILMPSSIVIALVFILLSNFLAVNYFNDPVSSTLIRIYAFTYLLSPLSVIIHAVLVGYQRPIWYKLMDFSREALVFAVTYVFLVMGFSVYSPMIAHVITIVLLIVIFGAVVFWKIFPEFFKVKADLSMKTYKKLVYFGLPVIFIGMAGKVFSYTDILILTYFRTLDEVGLYNAALPTARILWRFGITLCVVLLPLASELWAKKDLLRLREGTRLMYKYLALVMFPCAIIMFLYPKLIISLLFGESYIGGSLALKILVVGAIFTVIAKINFSMLTGFGKPKFVAKVTAIAATANLIGNLLLIPYMGIEGAAISTSLGFFLAVLLSVGSLRKHIELEIPFMLLFKTFAISIVFAGMISGLKYIINMNVWIELVLVLGVSGLVYLGLIFLLKIVTFKEVNMILHRIR